MAASDKTPGEESPSAPASPQADQTPPGEVQPAAPAQNQKPEPKLGLASAFLLLWAVAMYWVARVPPGRGVLCHGAAYECPPPASVGGALDSRFDQVAATFMQHFEQGREYGAQLAVHHKGRLVVDVAAGWADEQYQSPLGRDDIVPVYSSAKAVESLAVAMLVDRGQLAYDQPIAAYWPQFAAHGKAKITVAQLMAHQAGLAALDEPLGLDTLKDPVSLAQALADQAPTYPAVGVQCYHCITRGLYVNELVRRVDPKGRSLAQFVADEIAAPLKADVSIGLAPAHSHMLVNPVPALPRVVMLQSLPQLAFPLSYSTRLMLYGPVDAFSDQEQEYIHDFLFNKTSLISRSFKGVVEGFSSTVQVVKPDYAQANMGSTNAMASARGLAAVANVLALGGHSERVQLLSGGGMQRAAAKGQTLWDQCLLLNITYTAAGWCADRLEAYGVASGWMGYVGEGGSAVLWNPDTQTAIAYVPTLLYSRAAKPRATAILHSLNAVLADLALGIGH